MFVAEVEQKANILIIHVYQSKRLVQEAGLGLIPKKEEH